MQPWEEGLAPLLGCGAPYQELPPQGIGFPTVTTFLPPAGDSHPVTPPCGTTLLLVLHQLPQPRAGLGAWETRSSPVAWWPCWGHWSSLNLSLMLLAASLAGPDSWAHLPFQHWHPPNPQPSLAAIQNWGLFFS